MRICYFCNRLTDNYQTWTKFRSKIQPKICMPCQTQIDLVKYLDIAQRKALNVARVKARYAIPECREKAKACMRKYARNNKEKLIAYTKNRMSTDEEYRKRIRKSQYKYFINRYRTDPEFRERVLKKQRRRYKALNSH